MATPERKPRNNARKAAARELQRQNPGLSYKAALRQIDGEPSAPEGPVVKPHSSAQRFDSPVGTSLRSQQFNGDVVIGITDDAQPLTARLSDTHSDGGGSHMAVTGRNSDAVWQLGAATAASLRAANSPTSLQVVYVSQFGPLGGLPRISDEARDLVFDGPDARHDFIAWFAAEQALRYHVTVDAQAFDLAGFQRNRLMMPAVVAEALTRHGLDEDWEFPRILVVATDDGSPSPDTAGAREFHAAIKRVARAGRSLGVHLLLLGLDGSAGGTLLLRRIRQLVSYEVSIGWDSSQHAARAVLTYSPVGAQIGTHFVPTA